MTPVVNQADSTRTPFSAGPIVLELRDLEPPEPLRVALETLATLPPGVPLIARTRFRPVHLLSVLDERGFAWETTELVDGGWQTTVMQLSANASS